MIILGAKQKHVGWWVAYVGLATSKRINEFTRELPCPLEAHWLAGGRSKLYFFSILHVKCCSEIFIIFICKELLLHSLSAYASFVQRSLVMKGCRSTYAEL